jgi:hypothetical protein
VDRKTETRKAYRAICELLKSPIVSYANVSHLNELKMKLEKELAEEDEPQTISD